MPRVRIETGSRLHAGFYYIGSDWSIRWASAGFYIDLFNTVVEAWECSEPSIEAPPSLSDVVARVKSLIQPGACARVIQHAPRHMGLGSTTQSMLALAEALLLASGHTIDRLELARRLGRTQISGTGALAYAYGGFVADAGIPSDNLALLLRLDVPSEWRLLAVIPRLSRGYSEGEEPSNAPVPSMRARHLMASGFLRLASGIARGDHGDALRGLAEIDAGTGLAFSQLQGGVYRSDLSRIIEEASKNGLLLVQSSWGPTLYTLEPSEEDARADAFFIKGLLSEMGIQGDVYIARPRNRPATVFTG